jgi:hypothetical protein
MSDEPPMGRGVLRVQRQRARDWAETVEQPPTEPPPPTAPPVNIDVPYVSQEGQLLHCTMGNWSNTPTSYAYQWIQDDTTEIGDGTASYVVTIDDVGHVMTCVVTASNALGSTIAPASNPVTVA